MFATGFNLGDNTEMLNVRENFVDFLEQIKKHGNSPAITDAQNDKSISYKELYEISYSYARKLPQYLEPGDRVVVYHVEPLDWVPIFFGLVLRGCIVVPIDSRVSDEFIGEVISLTKPRLMVTTLQYGAAERVEVLLVSKLAQSVDNFPSFLAPDPNSPLEIIFTSGTWSKPKGVTLSQKNILTNVQQILQEYPHKKTDISLAILPLSHAYQQTAGLFVPLEVGSHVVFLRKINSEEIRRTIDKYQIKVLVAVPRVLQLFYDGIKRKIHGKITRKILFKTVSLFTVFPLWLRRILCLPLRKKFGSSLYSIIVGGAPLSNEIDKFFIGMGYEIIAGYGLSECSPVIALSKSEKRRTGEVGQVLPGIDISFSPKQEVLVSGDNLFIGYWPNTHYGNFNTGDVGEFDENKNLVLRGRTKNLVIFENGDKVFCEDVEFIANSIEQVEDSCLVEVMVGDKQKIVCLISGTGESQEILKKIRFKLPFGVRVDEVKLCATHEFPYTHTMKPDRKRIREMCTNTKARELSRPS